jgi:heat shock protein 5
LTKASKLADMLESDEKDKTESAVKDTLEWLDDNHNTEKEDYGEKRNYIRSQ